MLLLLSVATSGSAQHAGASLYKMSRLVRLVSIEARNGQGQYAKTLTGGRERGDSRAFDVPGQRSLCAFVQMKGDGRLVLEENHCTPLAQFGDIYIADIPLRHLDGLSLSESVLRIEAGRSHTLTMDTTAVIVDAPAVWNGSSLPQAYTGQGVVVGVMDVGFDVTSPNFYDTTLTATRIRRFWDQLSPDSIGSGMYVGADYRTPEEILAYAHSHDGLIETHGTHTLGIAAGTGFDTPYRGMAYDADICIVSNAVNTDLPLIPEELLYKYTSATDVLGFKYIFDYAQEVANLVSYHSVRAVRSRSTMMNGFSRKCSDRYRGRAASLWRVPETTGRAGHISISHVGWNAMECSSFRSQTILISAWLQKTSFRYASRHTPQPRTENNYISLPPISLMPKTPRW